MTILQDNPYLVGTPVPQKQHEHASANYDLYLIFYDIRDSKRLRHIAHICTMFGVRIQYSVFLFDIPEKHFKIFWTRINKVIDLENDRLIVWPICANCITKIQIIGENLPNPRPHFYFV